MSATPSQRWLRSSSGFLRVISVLWIATAARAKAHTRLIPIRCGSGRLWAHAQKKRKETHNESAAFDNRETPMRSFKLLLCALIAAAIFGAAAPDVVAQAKLPGKPIRLLVPFAPGGGVDVVARVVAQKVSGQIGQPVLVESKPGAGGALAVNELMRSEPDGATLLATTSSHATLPLLSKLPWHPSNDFTPIASVYSTMFVMATNKASTSHFHTLTEFLAYVRANPGKISWGSSGIAGPQHLGGMQFVKIAGVDMVHVPYRGNAPMLQALLANDVQLTFDTPTLSMPHIQDGKLAALAVTGERRMPKMPDVPTVKEAAKLDYTTDIWIFVLGPK